MPENKNLPLFDRHQRIVMKAKSFISENFQDQLSLTQISEHCSMSQFYFSRLFKKMTSLSPYQYVINVRLEYSVELLKKPDLSITDVCFDSGFNSLEHFATSFRGRYSMSPSDFRKTLLIKNVA